MDSQREPTVRVVRWQAISVQSVLFLSGGGFVGSEEDEIGY